MSIPSRAQSASLLSGCALVATLMFACNETATDGSGGTSTSTSTTSTSSSSPTSSSSGGGQCKAFEDESAAATATIKVHNETGVPAYFALECGTPSFTILTNQPGTFPGSRACLSTCEDLFTTDPLDCAACAPQSLRVDPGGTLEIQWDGLGLRDQQMPAACFHNPNLAPDCSSLVAAPKGNIYSFQIAAWSGCGNGQTCTCNANGVCDGEPSGNKTAFLPSDGEFTYQGGTLEFTLPACAFGCPAGG